MIESTIREWDGEGVVVRYDGAAASWVFLALHDTTLGPATGGTRLRAYPDPTAALEDAMRLAEGMTRKWAVLALPFGGGKAVIAPDHPLEGRARESFLRRYGRFLDTLRGAFQTGVDLGTSPHDMALVGETCAHVHGVEPDGSTVDPGPFTARGVVRAIEAALEARTGSPELDGRTILVQGVGDVGEPLTRLLADAGARVVVSDLDAGRARAAAGAIDGRVVDPAEAIGTRCDVFAPCAVGGVLDADTIGGLACRAVAGSANAQLAGSRAAQRLHARGILYAPDFVANGGGAAAFGLMTLGEEDRAAWNAKIDAIGDTLREIFAEAAERDESPLAAAERIAERRLASAREADR